MTGSMFVDVESNTPTTFYVYRYADGSVQVRKPEGNEVARQHGIHTINLTRPERLALARMLAREAKPLAVKVPDVKRTGPYAGGKVDP